MVSKHKYKVIVLVIIAVLITDIWKIFPDGSVSFPLNEDASALTLQWYVCFLTYHIQFFLVLIALYFLSLVKLVKHVVGVSVIYQALYLLDFILTYNNLSQILVVFATIVLIIIIVLTKWKR